MRRTFCGWTWTPACWPPLTSLNPGRGLILGDLADLVAGGSNAAVLLSYVGGGELPALLEKQIPQTLAIVSPDPRSSPMATRSF